jgi:membrane protease subunit (stomatin/prohibitin family)
MIQQSYINADLDELGKCKECSVHNSCHKCGRYVHGEQEFCETCEKL